MKYMKIKQAKKVIYNQVAKNGVITDIAMRVFVEHRIGRETFNKIVKVAKLEFLLTHDKTVLHGRKTQAIFYTKKNNNEV